MIPITPLTNKTVLVNIRSIEQIEETPETVLVLTGGRRMVVVDAAQNVVDRIHRVRAQILASASNTSRGASTEEDTDAPSPVGLRVVEPSTGWTDRSLGTGQLSNANPLHTGQISIDRTLAAIARCRWLAGQESADSVFERELVRALDSIEDLTRSAKSRQAREADNTIAERVEWCRDQLMNLYHETQSGLSAADTQHILRRVGASVKRLRRAWAAAAADSSRPTASASSS